MKWLTKLKAKREAERTQYRKEELEWYVNACIINDELKIVIRSDKYKIAIDPAMFKEEDIASIVSKIRQDNLTTKTY